jgi:hypothetical protein
MVTSTTAPTESSSRTKVNIDPAWTVGFDERQRKQIAFARVYARDYKHGADGHNNMVIIAQMADLLDKSEGYTRPADGP